MWAENEVVMIGEQVNEVVDNLCQKIGSTQQMLVPEMARLIIARSCVNAAFCALMCLVCILLIVKWIRVTKSEECGWEEGETWAMIAIFSGIALFICFGFLWFNVSEAVQWQAAPTAKAVEYILNLVRSR